ncbi:Phospholipase D zeta 1 [Sesamum angolense]|uniref:phospholipase D n=1 Tax=Sesamum angolense TaxID=2727404 RepID=A0AAE2C1G0_9LAMI|nr:Phospholipase D zeta 1 [Sesamum angolense]
MGGRAKYVQMQPEARPRGSPSTRSTYFSFHQQNFLEAECTRIFDELPEATIVQISRPDAADISPMMLTYTIEFQYKEFKWQLMKQASQVFYLHFALKKRKFIEEIHEKQEQVREWLQNLGIGDHAPVMPDDEEPDDEAVPSRNDEIAKNRDVPSSAALPIIRPALLRQHSMSDRARGAMQGYLNHFLSNIDIVNSEEVSPWWCKSGKSSLTFWQKLYISGVQVFGSFQVIFSPEYGPKLKEDYIMVWAVLKPGFLAFLKHPFDLKPLDIVVFDVLPASDGNGEGRVFLAKEVNDHNPLRHYFRQPVSSGSLISFLTLEFTALAASTEAQVFGGIDVRPISVTCGTRSIKLRTKSNAKVKDWVAAINDAGLRPPEGWCHSHRFGSFAPPRGLTADGSRAQWFVDGRAAFKAIALAIEEAKSEIFICGWWLCPELYLQRPFHAQASSRLDSLLESKAKQGVQEVALALKINSVHSKRKLLSIHENIRVLRYPDHFSTGVYLWSHHEKIVIVDHQICFIGGLDLCFGRYDYGEHKVGDHPAQIWPGKDYYNPSDLARHFVQRWNYAKIGVLIEDKEYVNSLMGGSYWRAGKFASSLRISLWSEHLVNQIRDPVIDSTYKDIWMATAKTNTMIYQDVFSCIPNDLIHTRAALRQGMSFWREKVGQTTIDLGIAPKKLETYVNGDVKDTDPMERLECVKGHLVSYPLEFMCKEDLRPVFNESEYYASPQVFH